MDQVDGLIAAIRTLSEVLDEKITRFSDSVDSKLDRLADQIGQTNRIADKVLLAIMETSRVSQQNHDIMIARIAERQGSEVRTLSGVS